MNVNSTTYNLCNNVNFKAYRHVVKNKSGNTIYLGDTCMFRHDLFFDDFVRFLEKKYANTDKVNIFIYGCSDGEEVYSLLSVMDKILGSKADKFLPIKARDIDYGHLQLAKNGIYNIESFENGGINFYLGDKFKNYFDEISGNNSKKTIKVKDNLKAQVEFRHGNLLEDVKNIDFHNTVLIARNMWAYLGGKEKELALELSGRMDKTSTLVIGNYDKDYSVDRILEWNNFRKTVVDNVFEPIERIAAKPQNSTMLKIARLAKSFLY